MTIAADQLSRSITLTPVFDQSVEGDETFNVALQASYEALNDYTIGTPSNGQSTIRDFVEGIFEDGFEDL